ncbi:MAG: hypothetical protein VB137_07010 [Burkholderia sp.]
MRSSVCTAIIRVRDRSCQPVELCEHQHVAFPYIFERGGKLDAFADAMKPAPGKVPRNRRRAILSAGHQ